MAVPPTPSRDEIRAAVRAARAAFVAGLTAERRTAHDAALVARLAPLLLAGFTNVAGFAAFGDEIDPAGLGFTIWPRLGTPGAPLSFHRAAAADLVSGVWGIREPLSDATVAVPDAVIVPLLAADAHGNRLGYGKGHYDRTLAGLGALRIGVAWDCQIVAHVPAEAWDQRLDWLVTPTRTIRCDGAAVGGGRGAD